MADYSNGTEEEEKRPWGWVFLFVLLVMLVLYSVFIGLKVISARRAGLPFPSWRSFVPFVRKDGGTRRYASRSGRGGISGWFKDKWGRLRGRGARRSGYGEPLEGPWDVNMGGGLDNTYSAHYDEDYGFEPTRTYHESMLDSVGEAPPAYTSSPHPAARPASRQQEAGARGSNQPHDNEGNRPGQRKQNPFASEEEDPFDDDNATTVVAASTRSEVEPGAGTSENAERETSRDRREVNNPFDERA